MKKTTIKAFTLVEMLIVIVIIGILIASLMPRMQSAQGRARDVARKNDLSQIQTAIITSQQDRRNWPGVDSAIKWMEVSTIEGDLKNAWMSQVPMDPNKSNAFSGLDDQNVDEWNYWYMVTTRNSVDRWWFVLMAKTEVEGSSNWIVCGTTKPTAATQPAKQAALTGQWWFIEWVDLKDVQLCSEFDKQPNGTCWMNNWKCTYKDEASLRYILIY